MNYTLPHGTVYPSEQLRAKAQEAAHHRRQLHADMKQWAHTLPELVAMAGEDRILARTRLKAALLWLPRIGDAKVQRILTDTGIPGQQRIGTLTPSQQTRLALHPFIVQHTAAVTHRRRKEGAA